MSTPRPEREVCRGCGEEIDPGVCWCGTPPNAHNPYYDGHMPVPMGCECYRTKPAMIGKPELILRPSTRYPSRPWALQLRVAGPAETSYAPIGHVSDNVACILADEGYAYFLFGDPRETCK